MVPEFGLPAVSSLWIDLVGSDPSKREQGGNDESRGDKENGPYRQKIAASPDGGRRESVSNRGEAGIASKPFADRPVPDEAQADRRNRGAEQATRRRMKNGRSQYDRIDRPCRVGEGADPDRRY